MPSPAIYIYTYIYICNNLYVIYIYIYNTLLEMSFANIISQSVAVISWAIFVISCFLIIAIPTGVRLFIFFNNADIYFFKFMGLEILV